MTSVNFRPSHSANEGVCEFLGDFHVSVSPHDHPSIRFICPTWIIYQFFPISAYPTQESHSNQGVALEFSWPHTSQPNLSRIPMGFCTFPRTVASQPFQHASAKSQQLEYLPLQV